MTTTQADLTSIQAVLMNRGLDLVGDFFRDALADIALLDEIPDGATLVLVPDDDAELARSGIEQGLAALRDGKNVYFRHIRRKSSSPARAAPPISSGC